MSSRQESWKRLEARRIGVEEVRSERNRWGEIKSCDIE